MGRNKYMGKAGGKITSKEGKGKNNKGKVHPASPTGKNEGHPAEISTCQWCKKEGHVIEDCYLKKKNETSPSP